MNQTIKSVFALLLGSMLLACENSMPANNDVPASDVERPYVIASQGTFSNTTTSTYMALHIIRVMLVPHVRM